MRQSFRAPSAAILPATQALIGKTKCTVAEAARDRREGSLLFCERDNGFGKKPTILMLSSSGICTNEVGSSFDAHHDQNFRPYGRLKVLGVMVYKINQLGGLDIDRVETTKEFTFTATSKFPLFVFK
jgi:hypothetical protein